MNEGSKIQVQVTSAVAESSKKTRKTWLKINSRLRTVIVVLFLVLLVFLAYGYIHTRNQLNDLSGSKATQTQTADLVNKVGRLVVLPTDETPTIATVKDASKLKSQ